MITLLEIENILLIKKASVSFKSGLCVLTGETGAGKSIILNSILFLLGKKTKVEPKNMIKQEAERGVVTGSFDISGNVLLKDFLKEKGFEVEDEIIIKRIINRSEKDRNFLNESIVSNGLIAEIGHFLIEVNRQNEQTELLDKSSHLKILDSYAETEIEMLFVKNTYKDLLKIRSEIEEVSTSLDKFISEKDFLENLVNEIEGLNLEENEEQILNEKKIEISKAIKDASAINDVMQKLFYEKNVRSGFLYANKVLANKGEENGQIEQIIERILNEIDLLEEAMNVQIQGKNYSEFDLDNLNERLFLIRDTARKYKVNPNDLLQFLSSQKEILNKLNTSDKRLKLLKEEESKLISKYKEFAKLLSCKRKEKAKELEAKVNAEFEDLEMQGASFIVSFKEIDAKETQTGMDMVEFLVSTNIGMNHGGIVKIASGGELSRILLAIKVVLLKSNNLNTIIFDEIDAGIGGKTSVAVGLKLKQLSTSVQVILITHQAQIASKADMHIKIQKAVNGETVETSLFILSSQEKEIEIARMLSGEASKEALGAARSLLAAI